ncbi:MAG: TonB-dependent receptor [Balneolales bacterium]
MKKSNTTSRIRKQIKYVICSLVVITFLGADLYAQNTGRVSGRVVEETTGEPLPGVNIVLQGTTQGTVSDMDGYYNILNIEPNDYNIVASMVGFARVIVEDVQVSMNENSVINFEMREEAIEGEEVTISAPREIVRLEQSQSRTLVRAEDLEAQAVSNLEEVLSTYPGISLTAGAGGTGLVIRGGNLNETDILVDGLSTRDMRTQQPNTTLNLTAINELEVISGGFTAEQGGIRSGMVNVRTKDGSMDSYEIVADLRMSPPQRKHFGPSPFSTEGPFWQVYAGPDAMTGVTQEMVNSGQYPFTWVGWNAFARSRLSDGNSASDVSPQEAYEIWKWQHRRVEYANKPDYILDFTLSGPMPVLPNRENRYLSRTSFMVSQRYDNMQLAYPLSRKNSIGSSTLLKLTTRLGGGRRLAINAGYLARLGVGSGWYGTATGIVDGTRQGTSYARNALQRDGMWNTAAVNPVDTRHFRAGVQYNHAISDRTFYEVGTEYTQYSTKQEPTTFIDPDLCIKIIAGQCYDETPFGYLSSDVGNTGEQYDILGDFLMSGGGRGRDNSNYYTAAASFTMTSQITRNHQLKGGADFEYALYRERQEVNHGESTTPREQSPHLWTYFDSSPINASAFFLDRIEYGQMIANVGVRADIMDYGERAYTLDPDVVFGQKPYSTSVYQDSTDKAFLSFEHLQYGDNVRKMYISPRLGVSHPITTSSKVFFNYGHFYQPPVLDNLYTVTPSGSGATIPNLEAEWPKTISYELGFEVGLMDNYLISFTGYYKDVTNQLSRQEIVSRNRDQIIRTWENNSYADIRGVEMRLQKMTGRWFRGWGSLEYSTRSTGNTGFRYIYENPLLARDQRESTGQSRSIPRPSVNANLIFTTPTDFGPQIVNQNPLGGWRLTIRQSWSDGGDYLWNPEARVGDRLYVEQIDYWNTDAQLNKTFRVAGSAIGFFAQITNLTNYRGFPNAQNSIIYRESLRFPFYSGERQGNDKWGDWDKDHIELGYHTWNRFINPRHFTFGIRMQM